MEVLFGLVGHNIPAPSSWCKRFLVLEQQRVGSAFEPGFLADSLFFGCRIIKIWFKIRLLLWIDYLAVLVGKGYHSGWTSLRYF